MNLKSFFAGLSKGLVKVANYIIKRISDSQIDVAIGIVRVAAVKFVDNAARREWAVSQLQSELKLPESLARWLVETAVLQLKSEAQELIDKAGDKVKELND